MMRGCETRGDGLRAAVLAGAECVYDPDLHTGPDLAREHTVTTVCHATRHGMAERKLANEIKPGDLLLGEATTAFGGGLAVVRLHEVTGTDRWPYAWMFTRDGRVFRAGHEWTTVAVPGPW